MGSSGQQGGRFVDYFVVCGLDPASPLELDQLAGESCHVHPLHRSYKSKVLSHYPSNVEWNPFDADGVNMLCMPKGLTFRTQKGNRQARFHSFVMTREDGSRTYGAALMFFEQVTSQHICAELQTLQHKYGEDRRLRKASAVEGSTGSIYDEMHPSNSGYRTIGSPRFQRRQSSPAIQGLASPRTRRRSPVHQACHQTKAYTLPRTHTDSKAPHFDMLKDTLYVSKCICLIMQVPFVRATQKFLEQIYEVVRSSNSPSLPMESFIFNILYEVPLPPMGRSMVFTGVSRNIACQRPSRTELPLCEYPLREVFTLLGTENVVDLLTCVLLEKQVILVSKDYQRLMLVAESMSTLIFPFTWPYTYAPILPASMLYFLDAPLPFIMGLHLSEANLYPESEMELPTQASMCYVDIDGPYIELPEELPKFPNKQTLIRDVNNLIQKHKQQPDNSPSRTAPPTTSTKTTTSTLTRNKVNDFDWSQVQAEVTLITALNQNLEGSVDGDQDSSYFSSPSRGESPTAGLPNKAEFMRNNEIVSRVAEIAQRTGVISSIADYENENEMEPSNLSEEEQEHRAYVAMLTLNCAIREVFLRQMVVLLRNYETFIIQPRVNSLDVWSNNRDQMQNFDKNAFLADTPELHLPFLSPFLETQLFASFIDNKIISNWEEKDQALSIFDERVEQFPSSSPQTPTTEGASFVSEAEELIRRRATNVDHTPCPPRALPVDSSHVPDFFPMLQDDVLLKPPFPNGRSRHKNNAWWRKNERQQQHSEHLNLQPHEREKYLLHAKKPVRQAVLTHYDQKKANQQFVEELLKECKIKTKKMLVFKMGQEAIELGHGDINRSGVEENTLIASLCDLLERIFSHGCRSKKQSKSALWWHLLSYRRFRQKKKASSEQNLAMHATESSPRHRRASVAPGQPLPALPTDFSFDLRNVDRMTNIRTEVGKSRAFVRLALERKVLHKHIKELVSNDELLKKRYRSEAFLRCEEEKMQFLYYLLSLNAVDFHCFTNSFPSTVVTYRVLINQSRKFQAPTTANPWMCVTGEMLQTPVIHIPKNAQDFTFQHANLGVLTTLRIGHDNAGLLPRWLVDYIYIRNDITGHAYKFPCGRWIGRNVDDGSLERLLVAEFIPPVIDYEGDHFWGSNTTPRRTHTRRSSTSAASSSPSPPPRVPQKLDQNAIQELLTDAVNNIVKHFYKPEKERGQLTVLLCGEKGLVKCMELVLQYGFRSARLFRNNFFVWDFLEKVARYLDSLDQDEEGRFSSRQEKRARRTFCRTLHQINTYAQTVGKDGKFQLLVCLGVRDHLLHQWLPVLAETPVTSNMYDECSFFHSQPNLDFLCSLLMQLDEFNILLEASVTKGIEL
ncbi:DENN domain-containing protein 5B-like [Diadema setosum]|uniref:DENN domain-containing protein 5B-like n=1 Tax=Diadema setosum TaxID=31175 RepID=UPI003B3A4E74